jgi:hypothetical protein
MRRTAPPWRTSASAAINAGLLQRQQIDFVNRQLVQLGQAHFTLRARVSETKPRFGRRRCSGI